MNKDSKSFMNEANKIVQSGMNSIKNSVNQGVSQILTSINNKLIPGITAFTTQAENGIKASSNNMSKALKTAFDNAVSSMQKAGSTASSAFNVLGNSVKAFFKSLGPGIIMAGIDALISNLVNAYQETKKIKNLYSDYKKEVSAGVPHTKEIEQLKLLGKLMNDSAVSIKSRKAATEQLAGVLGVVQKKNETEELFHSRINERIKERIKLLEASAKVEFYTQKKIEAEFSRNQIVNRYGGAKQYNALLKDDDIASEKARNTLPKSVGFNSFYGSFKSVASPKIYPNDRTAVRNLNAIIRDAEKQSLRNQKILLSNNESGSETWTNYSVKGKSEIEQEEEIYVKEMKRLNNLLKNDAENKTQYQKEIDELNKQIFQNLAGILTPEQASKNNTFKQVKSGAENPLYSNAQKIQDEMEQNLSESQKRYEETMAGYINQKKNGILTEEAYTQKLLDLTQSTLESIGSFNDLPPAVTDFINGLKDNKKSLSKATFQKKGSSIALPVKDSRDRTFDYKKSKTEKMSEEKSVEEQHFGSLKSLAGKDGENLIADLESGNFALDQLKEKYNSLSVELVTALNSAMNDVTSLDQALKIEQVKEDIDSLSGQLGKGIYSGVKDVVSTADQMVSSFQNLNEVFSDVDSTGWEKTLAVFNALTQTVDGFMSMIETIQQLKELSDQLRAAKEAEGIMEKANSVDKMANMTQEIALNTTKGTVETLTASKGVAAGAVEVSTSKAISTAKKEEALFSATASAAKMWWMAPAIIAAVVGVAATIGSITKKGSSGGSAAASSIRSVVNQAGSFGGEKEINLSVQVNGELKAKGTELVAAIDNNQKVKANL